MLPIGESLTVAVDDTLFRRTGRKVYAAHWGYDGSLKVANGNQKLSRGNTFVAGRSLMPPASLQLRRVRYHGRMPAPRQCWQGCRRRFCCRGSGYR